uniref:Uncharacterized protein n=1 Tax=Setaria viridis TaxID=4556 RepID=A0A4U6T5A1_SETVI|nr:hypothetical protein SEVIR_9G138875v2 [Setaria viridis]
MAFGASAPPEDRVGGHDDGDGGVDDAAAPSEDSDGGQDDRGTASEDDSDDDILPYGQRAVQVLAIRANFPISTINGYDWQQGRCIYRRLEEGIQEFSLPLLQPAWRGLARLVLPSKRVGMFSRMRNSWNTHKPSAEILGASWSSPTW